MVRPVSGSTPPGMVVGVVTVVVEDPAPVVVVCSVEVVVAGAVVVVAWSLAGTPMLAAVVDVGQSRGVVLAHPCLTRATSSTPP